MLNIIIYKYHNRNSIILLVYMLDRKLLSVGLFILPPPGNSRVRYWFVNRQYHVFNAKMISMRPLYFNNVCNPLSCYSINLHTVVLFLHEVTGLTILVSRCHYTLSK